MHEFIQSPAIKDRKIANHRLEGCCYADDD